MEPDENVYFPFRYKRTAYLRKNKIFGSIGENVMIQSREVPLYPDLIYIIGSNVIIGIGTVITKDIPKRNGLRCNTLQSEWKI